MAGAVFGWPPDVFWRATPAELGAVAVAAAVTAGAGEAAPPDAATLARLKEAFPDG